MDVGANGGIADKVFNIAVFIIVTATYIDIDDAVFLGFNVAVILAERGLVAQTTAVDVAVDGTGHDVDGGGVAVIGVHVAEGRAAVNVAIDGDVARSVIIAHIDGDVAADGCELSVAAAEDTGGAVGVAVANLATEEVYLGVAGNGAAGVAAAIDAAGNTAFVGSAGTVQYGQGDKGAAVDMGLVAATIDVGHGATANLNIAAAHGGQVAAAKDAARRAARDIHIRCAIIGRLVAAAKDPRGATGAGDIDLHGGLRCAVDVVAAVDIATVLLIVTSGVSSETAAIDGDTYGSIHGSRISAVTQTAAVEVAVYGTAAEGDSG